MLIIRTLSFLSYFVIFIQGQLKKLVDFAKNGKTVAYLPVHVALLGLLNLYGRLFGVEEDIFEGDPGAIVGAEESHVHILLRVNPHGFAGPEREAF